MNRAALAAACIALAVLTSARRADSQQPRPLPDQDAFFAATRENLSRAQREQYRYAYKERRSDLHVNPFGSRVGTDGTSLYEVTPLSETVTYRKLIERNGQRVTASTPERQDRRIRPQSPSTRSMIEDIVASLDFHIDHRERVDDRDTIVVAFSPRLDARPQTREGRIARNFKGSIWIDEEAHEVMRAQAVAIDDLSFGYGLFARLDEGTMATLTRRPVSEGIWLPTSVRFTGEGRAMLVRKLTLDYVLEWFDYRRVL